MAPTVNSGSYTKDLSKAPSLSGGASLCNDYYFIVPDDILIYHIVETKYDGADYGYIAEVYQLSFHSMADFIEPLINGLRAKGISEEDIVCEIIKLEMEDESKSILVARFAYDPINFLDPKQQQVSGIQIRGAFVDAEMSGAGFAGQVYRQLVLIHGHLVCDNAQTEFGAALWAGTIRDVVGRVDIYDCTTQQYIQELGDRGIGVHGFIPWDLNSADDPHVFQHGRWVAYPFQIKSCSHIVLIVSR